MDQAKFKETTTKILNGSSPAGSNDQSPNELPNSSSPLKVEDKFNDMLRRRRARKEGERLDRMVHQAKAAQGLLSPGAEDNSTAAAPIQTPGKPKYAMDDVIRLNVGGQRFDTRLKVLLADRSNDLFNQFVVLLEEGLTEARMPLRDGDGNFFLDRDPDHFRSLLNSLRYVVELQSRQKQNGMDDDFDTKSNKSMNFIARLLK